MQRVKPRAQVKSMFNGWALEAKGIRRVRTPEGARRYKLPIGSVIVGRPGVDLPEISKLGDGGNDGRVLKNIKIEDSEYEGFDKVRTSKGRTLYIGKFPGEDEVTVNDEDDNELESFDTVEEAFSWADKHGDEANFDDDEDTRAAKIAKNEPKAPDAPKKPSEGDSGAKNPPVGKTTDTGNTKKNFKAGDRVTSPITGKQYIVTGKPYRNGEIPVREINDDGTDNPDGTLRRIPARLLEPSTVKPKETGDTDWVAKKNADIQKAIGELKLSATSETPEGQKLYVDVLENSKTLDKSDAYLRFTSLPADERKRVISDLLAAEDKFSNHENGYVHSATHRVKPFRKRFEGGDRVQTKNEEEEQRRDAETPKPGKFYRSKTGSLTLEVTEVDKDAGRVYGFPVDETGRRKTSRRMSGPLDKFASSWDVADDISGDRGVGGGPETPAEQRFKDIQNKFPVGTYVSLGKSKNAKRFKVNAYNENGTIHLVSADAGTLNRTVKPEDFGKMTKVDPPKSLDVDQNDLESIERALADLEKPRGTAERKLKESLERQKRFIESRVAAVPNMSDEELRRAVYSAENDGDTTIHRAVLAERDRRAARGLPGGTGTSTRGTGIGASKVSADDKKALEDLIARTNTPPSQVGKPKRNEWDRRKSAANINLKYGIASLNDGNDQAAASHFERALGVGAQLSDDENDLLTRMIDALRGNGGGDIDPDNPDADLDAKVRTDREGGRTDQVQAAGKYGPKVQRNNEIIEMFREAMGDEDRTEENRQGLYRQIQHMQRQNEMYVTASRLPEDAQKLYMYSQGPPDPKPEEKAVLDAYGKLVEMDALDSALVLLEETEKSGNGSAHIANTIGKVRAVVRNRETAAHGGVPRPDPSSREFSGTLRTPVEWRGFGSKPASRERMIADGTWTSAMQRGFVLGERYRAALAEWEKLAEKSNDAISETKEGSPMGDLQYKAVPIGGVEDDDGQGVVTAIVAVTGMRDNVNDIIQPGAFQKSLAKRTPKGVWHHNITDSVSRTEEIKELQPGDPQLPESLPNGQPWPGDAGALMVKTRFNLNTARGRDAYEDVKFFGTDQEWSIGYNVPTGGATIDRKTGVRKIQTLDLYEYSPVLFGAMPNARTQSVKSAQDTWAAIARLDSDDPYDMEIKSLFEETIAEEKAAPPWAKKKKKGGDDAEDSSESEKNEDDEESSDDDGESDDHGFSFEDEDEDDGDDADTGKAGGGKFPFSKKPKAGKHAKKSFVFDSEAIDRVDRAVKSLADLRDYMVAEYKADAPPFPKKKFPAKKKKREGDPYEEEQGAEDEYENDDDSDYETDPNEAGEMSQLVTDAGIDDAQDAAESFDQAMQAGDMDGVADAANLILDAVEAAPADLADDEALKAVVQAVAQALSSGDAEQPTEQKDPAEQQPAPTPAADKKKPPFPPKNEGKSMVIDPRAILDAIG